MYVWVTDGRYESYSRGRERIIFWNSDVHFPEAGYWLQNRVLAVYLQRSVFVVTFVSSPWNTLHDGLPMQDRRLADRAKVEEDGIGIFRVILELIQKTLGRWRSGRAGRLSHPLY